jgi:hypothetical protein
MLRVTRSDHTELYIHSERHESAFKDNALA